MRLRLVSGLAFVALLSAGPGLAQQPTGPSRAEPWRGPADAPGSQPSANRARITSGEAATQPSAAEQRQARALAAAVFAKPAAGRRAADNAGPAPAPDWAGVQPRAEWTDKAEVAPGGRMKLTAPF